MNLGDLKATVAAWYHRDDLGPQMAQFVTETEERILERFNYAVDPPLVNNLDSNAISTGWPLVYVYGMLEAAAIYIQDAESAATYREKWNDSASRLNITGGTWAGGNTAPGKIQPYIPPEVG